jgi:hypothetical protein
MFAYSVGVDVDAHDTVVMCAERRKMASIETFHVSSCSGDNCGCLWELDIVRWAYVVLVDAFASGPGSRPSDS